MCSRHGLTAAVESVFFVLGSSHQLDSAGASLAVRCPSVRLTNDFSHRTCKASQKKRVGPYRRTWKLQRVTKTSQASVWIFSWTFSAVGVWFPQQPLFCLEDTDNYSTGILNQSWLDLMMRLTSSVDDFHQKQEWMPQPLGSAPKVPRRFSSRDVFFTMWRWVIKHCWLMLLWHFHSYPLCYL